ncbi:uncharacterized protein C3orf38 homolog [Anoplophora glabripennis]|uniref:uncharacterized protein C3orf38 homolog n=1 Tax=Anoplophora glabripennis TaxID=217634 RepID=UPI000875065F|nr:uncharacterized protein C3orf38 homolog [Anoplophora glabripennis]
MTSSNDSGIQELLDKLEDDDLFALAKTVTQGLLKIYSRDDASKVILKYSPDEISILRRKVVTREILFSYLDEKNIPVKLPTTKNDLIDQIIKLWNIYDDSHNQAVSNLAPQQISNKEVQEVNSISLLAEQFTKWFYSLMNTDEIIGSEHFYQDAKLTINMYSDDDCDTTVIENNPEEIVQALFQLKSQHNLFFNPNVSTEGIQGRMDPHGLVLVLACGTLHIQEVCAGLFEQVFALARDPFCDNNWKIKSSELNVRSKSDVIGPPTLSDSGLTSNLLMLPSS